MTDRAANLRIAYCIKRLRKEGIDQKQATAKAIAMEKAGRLDEKGGYLRATAS